jgi:hypothetical protein
VSQNHEGSDRPFYGITLWVIEKSQIEGRKHQNDSDIHDQSFPEMIPEDQDIEGDDNGYHRNQVRHGNSRSCHSMAREVLISILAPRPS